MIVLSMSQTQDINQMEKDKSDTPISQSFYHDICIKMIIDFHYYLSLLEKCINLALSWLIDLIEM